ncbi:MAG TPA: hypothetical protein VK150_04760, partial [Geothrix sp.]|nr:hypothetical protein [Geothrix sp.]
DRWPKATLKLVLFSNRKYALYRNEVPEPLVRDWKSHYLAEYDAEKKKLTIFPALPARRKTLVLDLCPDAKVVSAKFYRYHCQITNPGKSPSLE